MNSNMSDFPGHHTPSWMSMVCLNKLDYVGATEMVQQMKVLATKSDDCSLIPRPTWWEQKNNSCKLSSDFHVWAVALGHKHAHTYTKSK